MFLNQIAVCFIVCSGSCGQVLFQNWVFTLPEKHHQLSTELLWLWLERMSPLLAGSFGLCLDVIHPAYVLVIRRRRKPSHSVSKRQNTQEAHNCALFLSRAFVHSTQDRRPSLIWSADVKSPKCPMCFCTHTHQERNGIIYLYYNHLLLDIEF